VAPGGSRALSEELGRAERNRTVDLSNAIEGRLIRLRTKSCCPTSPATTGSRSTAAAAAGRRGRRERPRRFLPDQLALRRRARARLTRRARCFPSAAPRSSRTGRSPSRSRSRGHAIVRTAAIGLNLADLMRRSGVYPLCAGVPNPCTRRAPFPLSHTSHRPGKSAAQRGGVAARRTR